MDPLQCVLPVHFIPHRRLESSIPLSTLIPRKQDALTWVSVSPAEAKRSESFSAPASNQGKTHWFTTVDFVFCFVLLAPYLGRVDICSVTPRIVSRTGALTAPQCTPAC